MRGTDHHGTDFCSFTWKFEFTALISFCQAPAWLKQFQTNMSQEHPSPSCSQPEVPHAPGLEHVQAKAAKPLSEGPARRTRTIYDKRKKKYHMKSSSPSPSHSRESESSSSEHSPVRHHTKPRAPAGFRRSQCQLGHYCQNTLCYEGTTDRRLVWDKAKYRGPYKLGSSRQNKYSKR